MLRSELSRKALLRIAVLSGGILLLVTLNHCLAAEKRQEVSAPAPAPVPAPEEEVVAAPARRPILRGIERCFKKMTSQEKQTSPWGMSYGVASPAQGPAPTQSPCTPWYGYGLGVPTYSYGWFGATYRPVTVSHTGYYDNFYQWGYRRGF